MSNKGRGWGFWLRVWLPVFLGIGVIALESTKLFSAQETSGPLRALYQALFGQVGDPEWAADPFLHPQERTLSRLWFAGACLAARMVDDTAEIRFLDRCSAGTAGNGDDS